MRTGVNACDCTRWCTDTVRESALKVDAGRKILCRTGKSNLRQRHAGPTLYQLSYIPIPFPIGAVSVPHPFGPLLKSATAPTQRQMGVKLVSGVDPP